MYVCICNGVTDRQIREAADAGCDSVSEMTMRTGAGASCGSCLGLVAEHCKAQCDTFSRCGASPV